VHEHIKDLTRRLAKAGYLAVAPELYARQGDVSKAANFDEIRPIVAKVPDAQVMSDLDATADWAAKNGGDPKKLAVTRLWWRGRAHRVALRRAQPEAQRGRRVVWRSRGADERSQAQEPDRPREGHEGAGARLVRRCRRGHSHRRRGAHARGDEGRGERNRDPHL